MFLQYHLGLAMKQLGGHLPDGSFLLVKTNDCRSGVQVEAPIILMMFWVDRPVTKAIEIWSCWKRS
jgi:hypothetical protein